MRTVSFIFVATLAAASAAGATILFNASNANVVVKISAHGDKGKIYYGSGVVIGPNEVVTNCHVTRNARAITVSKGYLRHRVRQQQADIKHDLCLLRTTGMSLPTATIAESASPLQLGEPVTVYGYPGGVGITFFNGSIEALYPYEGGRIIETTASIGLGTSGGGVFDATGRLIGIATFVPSRQRGRYYAVATDWFDALRKQPATEVARLEGLAFWEVAEKNQPFFLRSAHLAGTENWASLEREAKKWTSAEASNPEAWHALGLALQKLDKPESAIRALREALSLNEKHAAAWYALGMIYASLGDQEHLTQAKTALAILNPKLAARLNTETSECPSPC
ncbi:MAG: trypsin-like peptidase domain-containing protein [Pseudomonadota bacterium]